jgi:hypothetical protein
LVAISAHGFGHLAQTAEVVNALRARMPDLQLSVRTALPRSLLDARFSGEFVYLPAQDDVGMLMASAVDVLVEESAESYLRFHEPWERRVREQANALTASAPDLVLANVPYLTLAGAARAGIPAVALCSLNWADIYAHCCTGRPEVAWVHRQIADAYRSAVCFLQPEPAMPMADLSERVAIGPIARRGRKRRTEIDSLLGLNHGHRLVLVAPGGIATRIPVDEWPRLDDVRWVVPAIWQIERTDAVSLEALNMPFMDILASCDALVTKPGYGSFTEAACNRIPVLYVPRPDWPEEPYLVAWLKRHGCCREIERAQWIAGDFVEELMALFGAPRAAPIDPSGAAQAAGILSGYLSRSARIGWGL